jgi:hypothetical protein
MRCVTRYLSALGLGSYTIPYCTVRVDSGALLMLYVTVLLYITLYCTVCYYNIVLLEAAYYIHTAHSPQHGGFRFDPQLGSINRGARERSPSFRPELNRAV